MASDPVSFKGVILRSSEFKDKDRLVKVITPDRGVVEFCAKGTGKQGSRFSFISMPYMLCDIVITESHGFYYLKDASIIESNAEIMKDLDAMMTASHMASCLIDCTTTDVSRELYELAVYAFYSLSVNIEKARLIYSAFNWRLLVLLGFASEYDRCTSCGEKIDEKSENKYKIKLGGGYVICSKCISSGYKTDGYRFLPARVMISLNFFASMPLNQIFSVRCDSKLQADLCDYTREFLSVMFEKDYKDPFSSLSYPPVLGIK